MLNRLGYVLGLTRQFSQHVFGAGICGIDFEFLLQFFLGLLGKVRGRTWLG